jgi:membrane protease YdiL (CAAX protease family)
MMSVRLIGIAVIVALLSVPVGAVAKGLSIDAAAVQPDDTGYTGFQETAPATESHSLLESVDSINKMTVAEMLEEAKQYKLPLLGIASGLVLIVLWLTGAVSPGGLAKTGLRDVSSHHAPMWMFAAVIVFTAMAFAQKAIEKQPWITDANLTQFQRTAAVHLGTYAVSAIVALGLVMLFSRTAGGAGLKFKAGDPILGMACIALAFPVIELSTTGAVAAHEWITQEPAIVIAHPTLDSIVGNFGDPWVWALIGAVVLGAPIVEEVIFRVFLQSAFLRWFGSPWLAIVFSAAPFAALHYKIGGELIPYYAIAPLFVLALAMGLAYERTRRIGVPIVMHMLFNATNVFFALRLAGEIG